MIRAKVNDDTQFEITLADNFVNINHQQWPIDLIVIDNDELNILFKGRSYNIQLLEADHTNKQYQLLVNGKRFGTSLSTELDVMLARLGLSALASKKLNDLKAPMPGLVLKIPVNIGDHVKKGDPILILEAMKMENVIKSPGEATVKAIRVAAGDKVEKNAVLIDFE